ncbi:MAG TPA: shikimate kinase [Thermoplasmata archaeon]|nr:shikimate kinase [Thermoplasmata archaeon]
MRGVGRAGSAVTIVNALLGGNGCAVGIDLGCRAAVEIRPTPPGEVRRVTIEPHADTPLVRHSLGAAMRWVRSLGDHDATLTLVSDIPAGVGLKSSSAVSCAIFEAVAGGLGLRPDPEEIARRSAELTRAMGLSATGAFDDALAASAGGMVLTDNRSDVVVGRGELDADTAVILWIPEGRHPPSSQMAARFAGHAPDGAKAFAAAQSGRYFEAFESNARTVERLLGLPYARLRTKLAAQGSLAVGVTGLGPALAAFAPGARADAVAAQLPMDSGRILRPKLRPEGGPVQDPGGSRT